MGVRLCGWVLECVFGCVYVQGDQSGKLGKISKFGEGTFLNRQVNMLDIPLSGMSNPVSLFIVTEWYNSPFIQLCLPDLLGSKTGTRHHWSKDLTMHDRLVLQRRKSPFKINCSKNLPVSKVARVVN